MSEPYGNPTSPRPDFEPPTPLPPVPQPPVPQPPVPQPPVPGPSHPGPVYPPTAPGQIPGAPEPGPLPGPIAPEPLLDGPVVGYDGAPAVPPVENVGRGILFSLLAVVGGAVLSALLYQWGFIASITSFLLAVGAGWLYSKGAGAPARKGTAALIAVIVVGVIISLFAMLGWSLYTELTTEYPGAPVGDVLTVVGSYLFDPAVWGIFATDALIFVAFAALGTFGVLRQLRGGRKQGAVA